MSSETAKYRGQTSQYCVGNGVDIGAGGDPISETAISVDLFEQYTSVGGSPIHWRGTGLDLPFKDGVLDFVYASHLLEDFLDWWPALREWSRVLKPGGHLVILVPDFDRWRAALDRGQPPNLAHKHEGRVGELSSYAEALGLDVIHDRHTTPEDPLDYSILFVGRKR